MRKAFDNSGNGDVVSYDVDLNNNNNNDSADFEDDPEVKDNQVLGKDFDLATKLIHLQPKQRAK